MIETIKRKIAVIGLGYVGLPAAVAFGKRSKVIAYDKNHNRISELINKFDKTLEVSAEDLEATDLLLTDNPDELKKADFYIIAVPTPIDDSNQPDLTLLLNASETVGKRLKKGDIVVYESTVYPGATEDECLPILEAASGLKGGVDFKVGYSSERINPGDKEHRFETITKVVSAQDKQALEIIASIYGSVIMAGIYRAASIRVAEAAKIIENTQRDLNIALMNELAIIFNRMDIDTNEVIDAAVTKWNFLPFRPGLVGGHCIGVDPYYLTYQAQHYGYQPEIILAGRRINDTMGQYVASQIVKQMIHQGCAIKGATVAILGLTFKENCPDLRNTKVLNIIQELKTYGIQCLVHDSNADPKEAKEYYDIDLVSLDTINNVDALVIAVAHNEYKTLPLETYKSKLSKTAIIIDVKGVLDPINARKSGITLWRL